MANSFLQKLVNLDRRIIYILIALAIIIPILIQPSLPTGVTEEVKAVYKTVEELPPRSVLFLALDFDPASKAELYPMAEAILHHAFRKDLRVVGMTFWPNGADMGEKVISDVAKQYNKESGRDYLYLGWKVGGYALVIGMGEDGFAATFPQDYYGKETAGMPVLENAPKLKDISYLVELASGGTIGVWNAFGRLKYKFKMGGGCTGVMAASWYNLRKIGWINGFLGGLRGAAEYEVLIDKKAIGYKGMAPQSVSHIVVILLIILSNIILFTTKKKAA